MTDHASVFMIFKYNIIEISFSRDSSGDFKKRMDVSQFLLYATSQYYLLVEELGKNWKRWLFFVLKFATGEGFRVESCRDYPREAITKINIRNFLINEYDLVLDVYQHHCSLRIDPRIKCVFFSMDDSVREYFKKKMYEFLPPFPTDSIESSIRIIDLSLIKKRTCLITPNVDQIQMWIIGWKPINKEELDKLIKQFQPADEIDLRDVLPLVTEKEIALRGWDKYRDPRIEQPFGLICPSCKMTYQSNLFAKVCLSCQTRLKKA
ncbi:MAG: hypothetical protein ACFE95_06415 [Candidatus Hodarchaeota archaeon]